MHKVLLISHVALISADYHIKLQFSISLTSYFLGKPTPKQTLAYASALLLLQKQDVARLTALPVELCLCKFWERDQQFKYAEILMSMAIRNLLFKRDICRDRATL